MFADHDEFRGAGKEGHFSKTQEELDVDRIDLSDAEPPVQPAPKAVSAEPKMNFGGPTLSKEDALRKIEVANEVLLGLSTAFDQQSSKGAGPAKTQVLLDGSPSEFAALFQAIKVDAVTGTPSPQAVLSNLNRRPDSEHRRLLNRGLSDLIERAMNLADESLDDEHIEAFLEGCVGYRTRLGL